MYFTLLNNEIDIEIERNRLQVPHFCLRHCLGVAWVWLGYGCQLVPYSKRSIRFEKCVQVFTMFTLVLIGSIICIYIYILYNQLVWAKGCAVFFSRAERPCLSDRS